MASATDICNLALSHLGNRAAVATIDPPDGSAEADLCALFYPMARDAVLEMHEWGFATARVPLSPLVETVGGWGFAYGVPADAITFISVEPLTLGSTDLAETLREEQEAGVERVWISSGLGCDFQVETDQNGSRVLLTNVTAAVLRYTRRVTDPTQFPPLFVRALSWFLAAELAGTILKGEAGQTAAVRCTAMAEKLAATASVSDANNQQRTPRPPTAAWIRARR